MAGGDEDEGSEVDVGATGAGFVDEEGSADIAGLEDRSGLVFSIPVDAMLDEAGNVELMGVVEGMATSLRRPLCEPAPIVVVSFFASSSLISIGMWE